LAELGPAARDIGVIPYASDELVGLLMSAAPELSDTDRKMLESYSSVLYQFASDHLARRFESSGFFHRSRHSSQRGETIGKLMFRVSPLTAKKFTDSEMYDYLIYEYDAQRANFVAEVEKYTALASTMTKTRLDSYLEWSPYILAVAIALRMTKV